MDRTAVLLREPQGVESVGRFQHLIAGRVKDPLVRGGYGWLILDEQDGLGPGHRYGGMGRWRLARHAVHAREMDGERRPLARLARHPDTAAALLDDAVHGRQAQTGPLARLLGGEEGLEDLLPRALVNPHPPIAHRAEDVSPGSEVGVRGGARPEIPGPELERRGHPYSRAARR